MSACNSYGWSGGFAALASAVSWFLIQDKGCTINLQKTLFGNNISLQHVQVFHYIAIVVGIVLFILSFFNFAEVLSDIKIIFILAVVGVFVSGCLMLWSVFMEFYISCSVGGFFTHSNVFDGNDNIGITIFMIDLIAGLLLLSAAISFARTY